MMMNRTFPAGVAVLVCVSGVSLLTSSTSTVKAPTDGRTPITCLPITLDEPGSYYLIGNLLGANGETGITIASPNVHLDLGGWTLEGVQGSLSGIEVSGSQFSTFNLSIVNGTITGWGGDGIDALAARNSLFRDLTISHNGSAGLDAGCCAVIERCSIGANDGDGLIVTVGTLSRCHSSLNGGSGYAIGARTAISDCVAHDNTVHGITMNQDCFVSQNVCTSNSGAGIFIGSQGGNNRVESNQAVANDYGIQTSSSSRNAIFSNTASGNGTANFSIASGNVLGAILDVTGGGTVTSGNSWANISH